MVKTQKKDLFPCLSKTIPKAGNTRVMKRCEVRLKRKNTDSQNESKKCVVRLKKLDKTTLESTKMLSKVGKFNGGNTLAGEALLNKDQKTQKKVSSTETNNKQHCKENSVIITNNNSIQIVSVGEGAPNSKKEDVYEFLSQSSVSEHEDPTSDVVKKLIEEGKAVLKHKKTAGKKKTTNKVRMKTAKEIKPKKKIEIPNAVPMTRSKIQPKLIDLNSTEMEISEQSNFHIPRKRWNGNAANNLQDKTKQLVDGDNNGKEMLQRRKVITDKTKLLQVARNFVNQSTPVNKKRSSELHNNLSPIPITSPWRPPDETFLPRVFYFSHNEDDLPSYSSDVIPSSQTVNERSSVNLSNIENIAPRDLGNDTSVKHRIPNRTMSAFRSPLKSINILDVVELPSRAKNFQHITNSKKESLRKLSLQNSNQRNISNAFTKNYAENGDVNNLSLENCFGFDNFIEDEREETENDKNVAPRKSQLKTKLKSLKRLLPSKPTRVTYNTIKSIFSDGPKQKDIRDMLTSTVIECNKEDNTPPQMGNESINLTLDHEGNDFTDLHLFDDLVQPETTFNTSVEVKTYTRQPRRRRKILNKLVLISDDESAEEEEERTPQKKKRPKPSNKKANAELEQFVEEFNSMCDEVEQYELQIEKVK